jgi:putative ubiquitin-RnfH superfamily antitoxin RatB of RatAB toxin-antitoxin module
MGPDELIEVSVVYALPHEQTELPVRLSAGATVADAIRGSGVLERHPEIDLAVNKTGIYGVLCELDRRVAPGDRVEIYRPLKVDPKENRRRRAGEA